MFGHKDENNKKPFMSQLFSFTAATPFFFMMWKYAGQYGYRKRNLFGIEVNTPDFDRAARKVWGTVKDLFFGARSEFGGFQQYGVNIEDYFMHPDRINKMNNLIDSTLKYVDVLEEPESGLQGRFNKVLNSIVDRLDNILKSRSGYRTKSGQTFNDYVFNLSTDELRQFKSEFEPFVRLKEFIQEEKRIPIFTRKAHKIYETPQYKEMAEAARTVRVKGREEFVNYIMSHYDLDQLEKFRNELRELTQVAHVEMDKLERVPFHLSMSNKEIQEGANSIEAIIENIGTGKIKYGPITVKPSTIKWFGSLDISEAMKKIPSIEDPIDNHVFLEKLISKWDPAARQLYHKNMYDIFTESGFNQINEKMMFDAKQLGITGNMFPEADRSLMRIIKAVGEYISDSKGEFTLIDSSIGIRSLEDSNHILMKFVFRAKDGTQGSFSLPIPVNKFGYLQLEPLSSSYVLPKAYIGDTNVVDQVANTYITHIREYIEESVDPNKGGEFLQKKILKNLNGSLPYGMTKKGGMVDIYNAARVVIDQTAQLKVAGVYGKNRELETQLKEFTRFKSERVMHFVDLEFGDVPLGSTVESKIQKVSIITVERDSKGNVVPVDSYEAVLDTSTTAYDKFRESKYRVEKGYYGDRKVQVQTERELLDIIKNKLNRGKIVTKAAHMKGGDVDRVNKFLETLDEKVGNIKAIWTRLDVMDSQQLMNLSMVESNFFIERSGKRIESSYGKIQKIMEFLKKHNNTATFKNKWNAATKLMESVYKYTGINAMDPKIEKYLHVDPMADNALNMLMTLLITDFRFHKEKNAKDWIKAVSKISKTKENAYSPDFLSASAQLRGFASALNPEKRVPFSSARPEIVPAYQSMNYIHARGLRPYTKRGLHFATKSFRSIYESQEGLSGYVQSINTLLSPTFQDGQIWMSEHFANTGVLEEQGIEGFILNKDEIAEKYIPSDLKPGTIIHKGDYIGKDANGAVIRNNWGTDVRVVARKIGDGKHIRIDVALQYPITLGYKYDSDLKVRGLISNFITNASDQIEVGGWFDPAKKADPGGILQQLVGNMLYLVNNDPDKETHFRKKEFIDSFNKAMRMGKGEKSIPVMGAFLDKFGNIAITLNKESLDFRRFDDKTYNKIMDGIFETMKKFKLTQNKYFGNLDPEMMNLIYKSGEYTTRAKDAMTQYLITMASSEKHAWDHVLEKWLMTGNYSNTAAKGIISEIRKKNYDVIKDLFTNKMLPKLLGAFSLEAPNGIKQIVGGMITQDVGGFSSVFPFMGTGQAGKTEFNYWSVGLMRREVGAEALFDYFNKEIIKQTLPTLGRFRMQGLIGAGAVKAHGTDLLDLIDKYEKKELDEHTYQLVHKFLYSKNPSVATIQSGKLYDIGGARYLTSEELAMEPDSVVERAQAFELTNNVNPGDGMRTVYRKQDVELLDELVRKSGGQSVGYMTLPTPVRVKIKGRYTTVSHVQWFNPEMGQMNIRGSDEQLVAMSKMDQTLRNIMIQVKGGDKEKYAAYVQQYYDQIMSMPNLKSHAGGLFPGFDVRFIGPTKRFLLDSLGNPVYENFTDDTILPLEILVNKGTLKNVAGDVKKAIMDNMTGEDLKMVAKYMKDVGTFSKMSPDGGVEKSIMHPMLYHKGEDLLADNKTTFNELIGMMERASSAQDLRKVKNLYIDAVMKGMAPTMDVLVKFPVANFDRYQGIFTFFRELEPQRKRPVNATSGVAIVGQYIQKLMQLDTDGDLGKIATAARGVRELMIKRFSQKYNKDETGLLYLGSQIMEGELPGGFIEQKGGVMMFDYKTGMFKVTDEKTAIAQAVKDSQVSLDHIMGDKSFDIAKFTKAKNLWTKEYAGKATSVFYQYANAFDTLGPDWTKQMREDMLGSLGWMVEYAIKQKNVDKGYIPGAVGQNGKLLKVNDVFDNFYNLRRPGVVENFETFIEESKDKDLTTLLGDFQKDNDTFWKKYDKFVPQGLKKNRSYLAALSIMHGVIPGLGREGDPIHKAYMAGNKYLSDLIDMNSIYKDSEFPAELFTSLEGIPFESGDESFGKNFKRAAERSFGEQATKNMLMAGKTVGLVAAGFMALNLFNPNQNDSLGHFPGKGGEYWDWTFSKPETEWRDLMRQPFVNLNDKNSVYLRMDNPKILEKLMRSQNKPRRSYEATTNRISPSIYDRNIMDFVEF